MIISILHKMSLYSSPTGWMIRICISFKTEIRVKTNKLFKQARLVAEGGGSVSYHFYLHRVPRWLVFENVRSNFCPTFQPIAIYRQTLMESARDKSTELSKSHRSPLIDFPTPGPLLRLAFFQTNFPLRSLKTFLRISQT